MTPRQIYQAHICNAHASEAWKRGALDGVLLAAVGDGRAPFCPYGAYGLNADADNCHTGLEFGQQLYQDVQDGAAA